MNDKRKETSYTNGIKSIWTTRLVMVIADLH